MKHRATAVLGSLALAVLTSCGGGGGGGSASGYCDKVNDVETAFDAISDLDPEAEAQDTKEQFDVAISIMGDLADSAPSEIEDDFTVIMKGFTALRGIFEDADWDFMAVASDPDNAAALEELSGPEFETATQNIEDYTQETCGVSLSGDSGDAGDSGDSGDAGDTTGDTTDGMSSDDTMPDISIPMDGDPVEQASAVYQQIWGLDEADADCLAAALMDDGFTDSTDPMAVFDVLDQCGLTMDDLGGATS